MALYGPTPQGQSLTEMNLEDGQTIEDILRILGIPRKSVVFAALNGSRTVLGRMPGDGDKVTFFSPLSGG